MLSTKLEFQKGQVKFSIPSIPSSRPQPSCDPPRLLISFSTLFRPTVSPSTNLFLRSSHLPSPYATSIFFSFVSSTSSMKRFVHRAHLYSSCTNRSSTHCTLLWRAINSRLTLGDRWARHPCYFLQDFHDRLPAACTEHMYPLTVFCLSLLGIRESTGVNRFHTTVHLWDSVCIHTFTWVYSFNEYTVQLFG